MKSRLGSIAVVVLSVAAVWVGGASGAVRYVSLDGAGTNGQSWVAAYNTIQAAVDDPALGPGDEIRVKQGTYVISSPVIVAKAVKIYGGYSGSGDTRDWQTYETTIDSANDAKRGFNVTADARIDGFTITRGYTWGIPPNQGGGIWIESCSAVVANCTFYRNYSSTDGGALATLWAHGTTIADCAFIENTSEYSGGAIFTYDSNLTIIGCTFTDNQAKATIDDVPEDSLVPGGGGIFNEEGPPTISDCVFLRNSAYYGAGISNYRANALIEDCRFADCDQATEGGGGIYNYNCSATIRRCIFLGNDVRSIGGAVLDVSTSIFVNCIMWNNSADRLGGAVHIHIPTDDADSEAVFTNCTLYGNHAFKGGGLYSDNAKATLTNCIVWGNTASDLGPGIFNSTSQWIDVTVANYCNIQGSSTYAGTGNLRVDPGFANPATGGFDLPFGTPCIDVGNNLAMGLGASDYEGKPRVVDGNEDGVAVVDMGALEYRGRFIADYLLWGCIFQTETYESPTALGPTPAFWMELETASTVDHIDFATPGGRNFTIPNIPYTSTYVKTYHDVVGDTHLWGYWVELNPLNPPAEYGDGTYHITVQYTDGVEHETELWYGVPGTSTHLAAPTQKPHVTSPSYGSTAISPMTLTWDACTDVEANHISVTIIDTATDEDVVGEIFSTSATSSNAYTLNEGVFSTELAFENSYDVVNPDGVPFEYGRAVVMKHASEVIVNTLYRFWSPLTSRHFYTVSGAERDGVIDTYPDVWTYEGPVLHAYATAYYGGLAPVFRFWSPSLTSHFYTMNEAEKESIIATYPASVWTYEGPAFYAYPPDAAPPVGAKPVYRFWNNRDSTHFYTISQEERNYIINTFPHFADEGIAFYAYE